MKPNYQFAKRQRDLAKKQKKEEKRKRKAGSEADNPADVQGDEQQPPADKDTTAGPV